MESFNIQLLLIKFYIIFYFPILMSVICNWRKEKEKQWHDDSLSPLCQSTYIYIYI